MSSGQERDTRQVLLDAASEEFARHGLPGARMHVIVERAGINERMIYHHFGSKVGLYEAVLAHHFRPPEMPAPPEARDDKATDAKAGDAKARFVAVLTTFVRGLLARPQFLALVLHEALSGWEHVPKASLADIPDVIRSSFEAARRAGTFRKNCRFEVVYLAAIGAMVSGHLLSGRFADMRGDGAREAMVAEILDLILRGASR
jgi:AcrR family transcriptional regulator